MSSGLPTNSPAIVAAFDTTLLAGLLIGLGIAVLLAVGWVVTERIRGAGGGSAPPGLPEPGARRFLRIAFGVLWVFDGILQAQPQMPLGLTSQVIAPAAVGSPPWLQDLVSWAGLLWAEHPVAAAASAVWIQIGIGLWMIVAPRGVWSRAGGLASVGWALVVWVFGEAMGGVLAPGVTWLFGAPGAVLVYAVAGALIALPERAWLGTRLGRGVLGAMGLFFLTMAFLQALPGTGFWQGGRSGPLPAMVDQMSQTPQPGFLASLLSAFGGLSASHPVLVNLIVVGALVVTGAGLLIGASRSRLGSRLLLPATVLAIALCLADWVLVEDLGFLGGLGTDPNSAIPIALICIGGYLAVRSPAAAAAAVPAQPARAAGWAGRTPRYRLGVFAAAGAAALVLVGVVPAVYDAGTQPASPILAQALAGPVNQVDGPAPNFSLVDQRGQTVSLSALRGKTVLLTFLDPVCTTDCPLIAQEFRQVDSEPGINPHQVALVAIVANPMYSAPSFTRAFTEQENLQDVPNWHYLTGSPAQLQAVWKAYGIDVSLEPAGAMVAHPDIAFVISPQGRTRDIIGSDPGPGTTSTEASFATLLANGVKQVNG
jgi:cytochrome oxidase Cu insertion factor (SCO1/SenC/PrrC family)